MKIRTCSLPILSLLLTLALAACGPAAPISGDPPGPRTTARVKRPPPPSVRPRRASQPLVVPDSNILARVLVEVERRYVMPGRIDRDKMLRFGLRTLEAHWPEVRIDYATKARKITARADAEKLSFTVGRLSSMKKLNAVFTRLCRFLWRHRARKKRLGHEDMDKLQYAVTHGVLATLDPNTNLLTPELQKELMIRTRGFYAGIGVVISIVDGKLTVISPIDGSPGARAGLQPGDHIVLIGAEPTIGMTLNEAVSLLRGKPNTRVTIRVSRVGLSAPQKITITRARIKVTSVSHKMLAGTVGYLRINSFGLRTGAEARAALAKLKAAGAKSLVLDMTNNPGGILGQAVDVVDAFVDSGEIVSTALARGVVVRRYSAAASHTAFAGPMVVLVNRGSASAAEIVAGALRNSGRALLLGETSFGKGTVQMLFDYPNRSTLKLTVAQYLLPGGESIQTVGVRPDILLNPVRASDKRQRLFMLDAVERLRARWHALRPVRKQKRQQVAARYDYLLPKLTGKSRLRYGYGAPAAVLDLAQKILAKTRGDRAALLKKTRRLRARWARRQQTLIAKALKKVGVDWRMPRRVRKRPLPTLVTTVQASAVKQTPKGRTMTLTMTVKNGGKRTLYRLHGRTVSAVPFLDGRELIFGKVDRGKTRTAKVTVQVPDRSPTLAMPLSILLAAADRVGTTTAYGQINIAAQPPQPVSFSYRFSESAGNGDGHIEAGETVRFEVSVKNHGAATLANLVLAVRTAKAGKLTVKQGRRSLQPLAAGKAQKQQVQLVLSSKLADDRVKLLLTVMDKRTLRAVRMPVWLKVGSRSPTKQQGQVAAPTVSLKPDAFQLKAGRSRVTIKGVASDAARLKHVVVTVVRLGKTELPRKVYYTAPAKGKAGRRLPFSFDVELQPGVSLVTAVARNARGVTRSASIAVFREK